MSRPSRLTTALAALFAVVLAVLPAVAQETQLPGTALSEQSLRPYRFVFLAYALAWVMVFGWVFSVARRMARLEQHLRD